MEVSVVAQDVEVPSPGKRFSVKDRIKVLQHQKVPSPSKRIPSSGKCISVKDRIKGIQEPKVFSSGKRSSAKDSIKNFEKVGGDEKKGGGLSSKAAEKEKVEGNILKEGGCNNGKGKEPECEATAKGLEDIFLKEFGCDGEKGRDLDCKAGVTTAEVALEKDDILTVAGGKKEKDRDLNCKAIEEAAAEKVPLEEDVLKESGGNEEEGNDLKDKATAEAEADEYCIHNKAADNKEKGEDLKCKHGEEEEAGSLVQPSKSYTIPALDLSSYPALDLSSYPAWVLSSSPALDLSSYPALDLSSYPAIQAHLRSIASSPIRLLAAAYLVLFLVYHVGTYFLYPVQHAQCEAPIDFYDMWLRRLEEEENNKAQCEMRIDFEEMWRTYQETKPASLPPKTVERQFVHEGYNVTPAVERYDTYRAADTELIGQYVFTACVMAFLWISVVVDQLHQPTPEPTKKSEEVKCEKPEPVAEVKKEKQEEDFVRKMEMKARKEQKKMLYRTTQKLRKLQESVDAKKNTLTSEATVSTRVKKIPVPISQSFGLSSSVGISSSAGISLSFIDSEDNQGLEVQEIRDELGRRESEHCERTDSEPVAAEAPAQICPRCSASSSPNWKFCSTCGNPLSGITGQAREVATSAKEQKRLLERRRKLGQSLMRLRAKSTERPKKLEITPTLSRSSSTGTISSFMTAEEDKEGRLLMPKRTNSFIMRDLEIPKIATVATVETNPSPMEAMLQRPVDSGGAVIPRCRSVQTQKAKNSSQKEEKNFTTMPKPASTAGEETREQPNTDPSGLLPVKVRKTDSVCIGSRMWPINDLTSTYPPEWGHPNKRVIAEIALKPDDDGLVRASRWSRPAALPKRLKRSKVFVESGQFSYDASGSKRDLTTIHWHMNFAGDRIFSAGEGTQISLEDIRAMEHPCLPSLSLAINDVDTHRIEGLSTKTYEELAGPTPILIKGMLRGCTIDSALLRCKTFSAAKESEIREMTTRLETGTATNIVVLPDMPPGIGKYTIADIRRLFIHAYTGFRAVVLESGGQNPVLHTGFWGCGNGLNGNKGLTAAIQILAAGSAGIKYMHFKPGNQTAFDRSAMWHGINVANALHCKSFDIAINVLATAGYTWGDQGPAHLPYQPPPDSIWTN